MAYTYTRLIRTDPPRGSRSVSGPLGDPGRGPYRGRGAKKGRPAPLEPWRGWRWRVVAVAEKIWNFGEARVSRLFRFSHLYHLLPQFEGERPRSERPRSKNNDGKIIAGERRRGSRSQRSRKPRGGRLASSKVPLGEILETPLGCRERAIAIHITGAECGTPGCDRPYGRRVD